MLDRVLYQFGIGFDSQLLHNAVLIEVYSPDGNLQCMAISFADRPSASIYSTSRCLPVRCREYHELIRLLVHREVGGALSFSSSVAVAMPYIVALVERLADRRKKQVPESRDRSRTETAD